MTDEPVGNARRRHLERLAWLLDNAIRVPFTQRRIGLDSLVGLVPGVGDAVGGLLSTWILIQGMRVRVPMFTLMQMIMNVAVEVVIGFIPVLGDLFDMGWKANHRNVKLLSDYLDRPAETARGSLILMLLILLLLMAVGIATVWGGLWLFGQVIDGVGYLWSLASG
ncbi:MAG: DUF4112 domain-containing protein [Pseudomonadota bacterium]